MQLQVLGLAADAIIPSAKAQRKLIFLPYLRRVCRFRSRTTSSALCCGSHLGIAHKSRKIRSVRQDVAAIANAVLTGTYKSFSDILLFLLLFPEV